MVAHEITMFINYIHRYLESEITGSIPKDTADSTIKNIVAVESKWKKVFWEKNSVEPAMLR
jgi:hypothetical protein